MKLFMHPLAAAQRFEDAIGTRVMYPLFVHNAIMAALETHDFGKGPFVLIPDASDFVVCGVAPKSSNPEDYVLREHRGEVSAYRRRYSLSEEESRPETVAAIIYTSEMYLADPQTSAEEKAAFIEAGYTHAWITTLGMKGPKAPVGSWRFVVNLAGGNAQTLEKDAEELQAEARAVEAYWSKWSTVA